MDVTGKAIAERLGISTATVSLALNNKQGVNPRTREAILACRDELRQNTPAAAAKKVMLINTRAKVLSEFAIFQQSYIRVHHSSRARTAAYRLIDRMEGYNGSGITYTVRTELINAG